jgi:HD superfamily phosphohydrolase
MVATVSTGTVIVQKRDDQEFLLEIREFEDCSTFFGYDHIYERLLLKSARRMQRLNTQLPNAPLFQGSTIGICCVASDISDGSRWVRAKERTELPCLKTNVKEIRDPIHNFIHVDRDEMELVNSRPFQRLRHIHQLALTHLVYPSATHKRFEHSLGVMELAGRAFDAITNRENVDEQARSLFPQITTNDFLVYWRKVLRVAALCHDLGHPPFSHGAERELFPKGYSHETMTRIIIGSDEMQALWRKMTPRPMPEDIVKLSLGPKEASGLEFSDWELLLAEIISGNSLGVDRMDYLLRDSHHLGVGYGEFDHFRLLETLRIVVPPPVSRPSLVQGELALSVPIAEEESTEPVLGLLVGGIHSAEALLLARYFMFAQVYFHSVRVAYNYHLKDFLMEWLPSKVFPTEYEKHLALTDNEVNTAIQAAAADQSKPGHIPAKRIAERRHFKLVRSFTPDELTYDPHCQRKSQIN